MLKIKQIKIAMPNYEKEDIKKEDIPVLTHLGIKIGKLFIHADKVWVRTSRYSATTIGSDSHSCHFGNLSDYQNVSTEYLEFTILDQDIIQDLILNKH